MELLQSQDIHQLKAIIRKAGAAVMDIYRTSELGVEQKADQSPLTLADTAADKIIGQGLEHHFSGKFGIISEERANQPYEERIAKHALWIVDPLDGTKEFIKRNDEFTINIGLLKEGRPVFGMVLVPAKSELYWGGPEMGSWKQEGENSPASITVDPFVWNQEGIRVLCSRSHINDATQEFLKQLKHPVTVPAGSSLKFLKIAEGKADVYPRLGPTMEWDTAAAEAILLGAGGHVWRYPGLDPMQYNKRDFLNPHFLAYGKSSQPQLEA